MAAKALETAEAARLAECERVIEGGLDTFMAVGEALTEIRDAKLYRVTHRTFEAYCLEKWRMGRARAYRLIDHANAMHAITEAAGDLSPTGDISERETRAIKGDLPAVVEDIKARVASGEKPAAAAKGAIDAKRNEQADAAKTRAAEAADRAEKTAEAKRQKEAEQAENERIRQEAADKLPDAIKAQQKARAEAIAARKSKGTDDLADGDLDEGDRIAELEEEVRALDAEVNRLKANLAEDEELERMRSEWRSGGWDKAVEKLKADHAFEMNVLHRQIETFTSDRAAEKRRGDFWKRKAEQLGYSNEEVIDLREAANG